MSFSPSIFSGRATLITLAVLAIAGLALGWNKGQLPRREQPAAVAPASDSSTQPLKPTPPDLALYQELIISVRGGANYYDAAREALPRYGFPITSPLNWRLPTYAWLFSLLPNKCCIQAVLLLLATGGLMLSFTAASRLHGPLPALLTSFLLFGVVRWTFDGEAYLAQEVWAAVLLLISLSAHALARQNVDAIPNTTSAPLRLCVRFPSLFPSVSLAAGIAALSFRELTLPYCGLACLLAAWNRRWLEAAAWAAGIAAFFVFFAWHVGQVQAQLAGLDAPAAGGLSQWLRFGGLDFVLLTTRMNSLLFHLPPALLWLYLLAALLGLAKQNDETSQVACLSSLAYLLTFAFLGRPENFYWGLLPAPFLAWGLARAPLALSNLWTSAALNTNQQQSALRQSVPSV